MKSLDTLPLYFLKGRSPHVQLPQAGPLDSENLSRVNFKTDEGQTGKKQNSKF